MADAFCPPAGPVSTASAVPFGAKVTEKRPGPALGFITIGDNVPSLCTAKASMLLVKRSVASSTWPLGLRARDAAPEVLVLRKLRELGIGCRVPSSLIWKPATLLLPPVLST